MFFCVCFNEFFSSFFYILHIFISLHSNTKQYKRGQHKHSSSADSVSKKSEHSVAVSVSSLLEGS